MLPSNLWYLLFGLHCFLTWWNASPHTAIFEFTGANSEANVRSMLKVFWHTRSLFVHILKITKWSALLDANFLEFYSFIHLMIPKPMFGNVMQKVFCFISHKILATLFQHLRDDNTISKSQQCLIKGGNLF